MYLTTVSSKYGQLYSVATSDMANLKRFKGHCTGGKNQALHDIVVEAINPPQAREFLEARYPGYSKYYVSGQIY